MSGTATEEFIKIDSAGSTISMDEIESEESDDQHYSVTLKGGSKVSIVRVGEYGVDVSLLPPAYLPRDWIRWKEVERRNQKIPE